MGKKKSAEIVVELAMLPAPETLTADEALAWLDEWAGAYLDVFAGSFDVVGDHGERWALSMLAIEVREMVEACATAAPSGGFVRVSRMDSEDVEYPGVLERLAILGALKLESNREQYRALGALAHHLAELLFSREAA